jgi:tetratricopeptide (TPR) repeat protein
MSRTTPLLVGTLTLAGALLLATAEAGADDRFQRAKAAFKQGRSEYRDGAYARALKHFQTALRLAPHPNVVLNIAQCYRLMKQPQQAVFYYKTFLKEWRRYNPDRANPYEAEVKGHIARLEPEIRAAEAQKTQQQGEVERARQEEARRQKEAAQLAELERARKAMEAAEASRRAERAAYLEALKEKEAAKQAARQAALREQQAALREKRAAAAERERYAAEVRETHESKTFWGYGGLLLGGASLITAAVLYGVFVPRADEAHDAYRAARDPNEIIAHLDELDAAETKVYVGHVFAAVGAVASGVAFYLLATRPSLSDERPGEHPYEPGAGLSLAPLPGGGAVLLRGRF